MKVNVSEEELGRLVDQVVQQVKLRISGAGAAQPTSETGPVPESEPKPQTAPPPPAAKNPQPRPVATAATDVSTESMGVYPDVEQAVRAAQAAYEELMHITLQGRGGLISAMRQAAVESADRIGKLAAEETGLGKASAKVQKILLAARKTPGIEDLLPLAYTGDDGLTLVEPGPFGVVGAITPSTNPPSTVINNAISLVASGNSVVFNPHPGAKQVTNETVSTLNRAIASAGGPRSLLCSLAEPSLETGGAIMRHPGIKILLVTGGGAVVKAAMTSGKRTVAAGPGNPPVIVDDTCNITKAARCIVDGASFDNNVLCIAEKEIFVYHPVADRLKEEMQRYGAVEVKGRQMEALVERCLDANDPTHPMPRRDMIGKDAALLLKEVGVAAHPGVRVVICEVNELMHPLVQAEQLMPFLPILRVDDLDQALEYAKQAEHGFKHTAIMHSESVSAMSRVAREIETTIFVKNAPSYAGLGFGGEGFTTLSIAGPTGEGLTSARTFTRQRRCVLAGAFRIV
jgi:propionaldehyde dehydrogenase